VPKIALGLFAVILALLGGLSVRTAGTSEINVLCSGAMRAVLQQVTPAFEESSGDKLAVAYASAGKVADKVAAEEVIDVAS
jgi:ABC-type molybdate transport system substrate-binding protein